MRVFSYSINWVILVLIIFYVMCNIITKNRVDQYKKVGHEHHYRETIHPMGFIMVRCIQNDLTRKYWYKSYQSIRKLYPDTPIVIIDDNSDPKYIEKDLEAQLVCCKIVRSEYPKRGEMLGYYYYLKNHWFERAVVIHDSVFLREKMDFGSCKNVKFLWYINSNQWDDVELETKLIHKVGGPYPQLYKDKAKWKGCFGVMSVIDYEFLKKISYMFVLMDDVTSRRHRSCIERIFAVLCFHHYPELKDEMSVMGDIHQYVLPWGFDYQAFEHNENHPQMPPIVKVWTGR